MKRCTDPLCATCWPESYDPPPEEMGWGWPYLVMLAVFVVFVIVWMVQGGAFRL